MPEFLADEGPVRELWAVIAENGGLVAAYIGDGQYLPLVTYSARVSERFREMLPFLALASTVRLALIRAVGAHVVEMAYPGGRTEEADAAELPVSAAEAIGRAIIMTRNGKTNKEIVDYLYAVAPAELYSELREWLEEDGRG